MTIHDAKVFRQRPKIEDYDDYMYLVVFGVDPGTAEGGPLLREVHMIITGKAVVTIHRRPNDALADLRAHYDDQHIRSEQFLVYKILDAITSTFVPVLTRIDDAIDTLEEQVIEDTSSEQLQRIFSIRRDLVAMRRVITPMRDMFQRSGDRIASLPGLETDDKLYFRDLYDGLIRTSELVDSYRDLLSGATDMYLSQVANKQGEINKQLTIIATIFLPLSFLTGFFGQNFSFLTNHVINQDVVVLGAGGRAAGDLGRRPGDLVQTQALVLRQARAQRLPPPGEGTSSGDQATTARRRSARAAGIAARIAARIGAASSVCAGDTSSHSGARIVSASGPCETGRRPSPPYGSSAYPRPLRAAVATPDRCGASAVITASAPSWRIRPIASSRKLQGGS